MKRWTLIALLMLLVLLPLGSHAAPTVTAEPEAAGVPAAVAAQLAAEYPDAKAIVMTRHHTGTSPLPAPAVSAVSPAQHFVLPALLLTLGAGLCALYAKRIMRT